MGADGQTFLRPGQTARSEKQTKSNPKQAASKIILIENQQLTKFSKIF